MTLPIQDQAIAPPDAVPDKRTLAIFDLDGTLVNRDTFLPFLIRYTVKHRRYWPLLATPFWILLYLLRLVSARTVKERLLTLFLKGETKNNIAEHADDFCSAWLQRRLRPHVIAKLREHQQAGDRVILESASPDVYVSVIGKYLGIGETVCTRVGWDGEICTGRILGPNCKGDEKVRLLREYLHLNDDLGPSYAYGDSRSDLPLLRWVQHGFLVKDGGLASVSVE